MFFRSAAFGGFSFLLFKEVGLRVTRMLVKHCKAMAGDLQHYRRRSGHVKTLQNNLINEFHIHFQVFIFKLHEVGGAIIIKKRKNLGKIP